MRALPSYLRPFAGIVAIFAMPLRLGFLPLIAGLASSALSSGALGGGNKAPDGPLSNTGTFGNVTFGAKYIGSDAVAAAPTIIQAENQSWTKYIPWMIGGGVALFALLFLGLRKRK